MKKINFKQIVNFSLIIILTITFNSCDADKVFGKLDISKTKDMTVESIEDIIFEYNLYDQNVSRELHYSDNSELNQLRLGIHTKEGTANGVLVRCSSKTEYNTNKHIYQNFSSGVKLVPLYGYEEQSADLSDNRYHIYFKIEVLQEMGIISQDSKMQEDLCFFDEYISTGGKFGGPDTHTSTKRLKYKADEVNKIMQQYKEMMP